MNVIHYIGLDVHNDSIAISIAPGDSTEVRRWGVIGGTHDDVLRFIKKLHAAHPEAALRFCYEAGPRVYPLCRFIRSLGHECIVVCPSRVPRRDPGEFARAVEPGERVGITAIGLHAVARPRRGTIQ